MFFMSEAVCAQWCGQMKCAIMKRDPLLYCGTYCNTYKLLYAPYKMPQGCRLWSLVQFVQKCWTNLLSVNIYVFGSFCSGIFIWFLFFFSKWNSSNLQAYSDVISLIICLFIQDLTKYKLYIIFYIIYFERSLLCSHRLHLFDHKCCKNSNIVKYF